MGPHCLLAGEERPLVSLLSPPSTIDLTFDAPSNLICDPIDKQDTAFFTNGTLIESIEKSDSRTSSPPPDPNQKLLDSINDRPPDDKFGFKYYSIQQPSKRRRSEPVCKFPMLEHDGAIIGPDTHYLTQERDWRCFKKRRAFLSNNVLDKKKDHVKISQGDCILVRTDEVSELDQGEHPTLQFWKAKVWEIRALDKRNVYALVSWFERPEDVQCGPKPYQGRYELVATTEMAIIHADTIQETITVEHWDESNITIEFSPKKYYWRQTRLVDSTTYSACKSFCYCSQPRNLDQPVVQCQSCHLVMHDQCSVRICRETTNDTGEDTHQVRADSTCFDGWDSPSRPEQQSGEVSDFAIDPLLSFEPKDIPIVDVATSTSTTTAFCLQCAAGQGSHHKG